MVRKFSKLEIDMLYDQLRSDEEVLWKGKPKLIPNLTILTTLAAIFIVALLFTTLVIVNNMEIWYILSLIALDALLIIYVVYYAYTYYENIKNVFYVITNTRLAIVDAKNKRMLFYKRYSTIKILRVKKTILNTASIIFDVDFTRDKMREIGFINVTEADRVLEIINKQITHMRT